MAGCRPPLRVAVAAVLLSTAGLAARDVRGEVGFRPRPPQRREPSGAADVVSTVDLQPDAPGRRMTIRTIAMPAVIAK